MKTTETIINKYGFRELKEKPTVQELSEYYSNIYYQNPSGSYEKEYSSEEIQYIGNKLEQKYLLIEDLIERSNDKKTFLDIGCGEGWSLSFFKNKGYKVKGIEHSSYACKTFNKSVVEELEVGDAYEVLRNMKIRGGAMI